MYKLSAPGHYDYASSVQEILPLLTVAEIQILHLLKKRNH